MTIKRRVKFFHEYPPFMVQRGSDVFLAAKDDQYYTFNPPQVEYKDLEFTTMDGYKDQYGNWYDKLPEEV